MSASSAADMVGRARRWAPLALLLLALVAAWLFLWQKREIELRRPDAMDYAQVADQVRNGQGFTTRQVFPRQLEFHRRRQESPSQWPLLHRDPLLPLLAAAAGPVAGDRVSALLLVTTGAYVAAGAILTVVLWQAGGPLCAGIGLLLFVLDTTLRSSALAGMTEALGVLLSYLMVWGLFRGAAERSGLWYGVGLLAGLGYLTRVQLLVLLPCALVACWAFVGPVGRWRHPMATLAGWLTVVAPWAVRNLMVTGSPIFNLSTSRNLMRGAGPGDLELEVGVESWRFSYAWQHRAGLFDKVGDNLERLAEWSFWTEVYGWTWPAAVLGVGLGTMLWLRPGPHAEPQKAGSGGARRVAAFLLCLVAATLIAMTLAFPRGRFLVPAKAAVPVLVSLGLADLTTRLWNRISWRGPAAAVLAGLSLWSGLRGTLQQTHDDLADRRRALVHLLQLVPAESVLLSDVSHEIVLLTDRRAVRLPARPAALFEVGRLSGARYLLLGSRRDQRFAGYEPGSYARWAAAERVRGRLLPMGNSVHGDELYCLDFGDRLCGVGTADGPASGDGLSADP